MSAAFSPLGFAPPRHVAIIMDGNGRWARARGLPRTMGHREGVEALRRTVEAAGDLGVSHLTVFGFSTENWRRPAEEIDALFDLLRLYVHRDLDRLVREGVRVRIIGERTGLSEDILGIIDDAERRTRGNSGQHLTIAFNYGGQAEIARAARKLAEDVEAGRLRVSEIDVAAISARLDTVGLPDPDLVIRTSGERRLSNFLLWQAAYAELVFVDATWPEFDRTTLVAALEEFSRRIRRYGATEAAQP